MRISGGSSKGRRTATKKLLGKNPQGGRLRPTSAKVREALFDILRNKIDGASFVDLYAGTGAVGFEALSRGAASAFFIETDPALIGHMKRNALGFGFSGKTHFFRGRADEFLGKASLSGRQYDIFFVDPPYESGEIERILPVIGKQCLLHGDGAVVVEHFFKKQLPERVESLALQRIYRYGDTVLTLYRRCGG